MALFEAKDEGLVKTFLFNKIEKECDADPAIMADYILVTLQNDMNEAELKAHCKSDLTEFFGDQTGAFVDTLFDALARKQYLPQQSQQMAPQPETASLSIKGAGTRGGSGPDQAGRGDGDRYSGRGRSRSPTQDRHRRQRDGRSRSRERERRPAREQHHGGNPLLDGPLQAPRGAPASQLQQAQLQQAQLQQAQLQQLQHHQLQLQQQQQQQQMMPHMQMAMPMAMQMQPRRRKPCFEFLRRGRCQRGDECSYAHVTPEQAQAMGMQGPPGAAMAGMMMAPPPAQLQQPQQQQPQQPQAPQQSYSQTGVFVSNIPPPSLTEAAVRGFFARFGEITGVWIDGAKQTATIAFSDAGAQARAVSSPEAPFNNRFVRVHRAFSAAMDRLQAEGPGGNGSAGAHRPAPGVWHPKSAAIKKAELIEKYVEQQKELMRKLTTTKDMPAATRKIIMDSIKQIQQKIEDTQKPKPAEAQQPPEQPQGPAAEQGPPSDGQQQQQQQQLDAVAAEKAALQAKLRTLQEKAAQLGAPGRGRGRGRGRGAWPGAAGRGAMTLDKRPRTLVLRNVSQAAAEQLSSEMAQFGAVEHIDKLGDDHSGPPFAYTVKYQARWEAEQALKATPALELFSDVTVDWEQQQQQQQ
ncbi:hypothetical protein H4R18_003906 [Coemansia javaensis]|uniref:C3H1-type domain-containing protein n=1 Tax=Coemansia javaensis TaxID=2761396 RepID=A0A9W8LHW5_9FUNG|nr:hypothetical protein H4R18_003906 [Coemansia javaensis]